MKNQTLKTLIGYSLAASLAVVPLAALAKDNSSSHASVKTRVSGGCLKAFGHLIAPGWIKLNGTTTVDSTCKLPFGIAKKLGIERPPHDRPGTTTPDTTAPSLFLVLTSTGTSTATVTWFTNERSDSRIAYGTTTAYGETSALNSNLTFFHSATVTGLNASTTYHFQAMSRDASGNLGTSADGTFTTDPLPDTTAPTISAVGVTGVDSTTATVSWTTDEPATGKVYFDSGTTLDLGTADTASSSALLAGHAFLLGDLSASTTYSFAVQSADASGNTSTSATGSFVTGL